MRSHKDFFLGLGLGLIFVALLWIVSLQAGISDNVVITKAKELGMVFPKDIGLPKVSDLDINEVIEDSLEVDQPVEIPVVKPIEEKHQRFTIAPGSSARVIANDLANLGVIEDADIFVNELTKMQLTGKIKARSYNFNVTSGPLDIYFVIREITK